MHVIALGKAGVSLAESLAALSGDRLAGGIVATKYGHGAPVAGLEVFEGGHPVPDAGSLAAGKAVLRYAESEVGRGDLVWVAISGGSSAVCCVPADGLTLTDKRRTTDLLLRASADIHEINTVRKHLSAVKGGRLAQRLQDARVCTLLVSDVIGDDPGTIGSGPTAADATTYADAIAILRRHAVWDRTPVRVRRHLEGGRRGAHAETPAPGDPVFRGRRIELIATNRVAVEAAAAAARAAGFMPLVLSTSIAGETRDVAEMHAAIVREICETGRPARPPVAVISGGETVVHLGRSRGRGGRAQEFTLACIVALGPVSRPVAVACVGTDGTDGPTDAAGAVADDRTLARAAALGLPPAGAVLRGHDAYPWFDALEDLVRTGPTGTNVMDIRVALIG